MQLNLFFAIVGGLWFWFAASLAGYSWIQTLKSPIVVGTVLGALTGNLETGLITGGSIENCNASENGGGLEVSGTPKDDQPAVRGRAISS